MELLRATRAEINLDNLKHNIAVARSLVGDDVEIMAVIKSDCYGHGAAVMMEYMMKYGLRHFGVASLNEALELRRAHREGDILVLGLTPDHLLHYCVKANIVQTVCTLHQAQLLSACGSAEIPARIQIKVDTGLHRLGMAPTEENMDVVAAIATLPNLRIEGIFSHMALRTPETGPRQDAIFREFVAGCEARGVCFPFVSICDGNALLRHPELHHNLVRPGSLLFGFGKGCNALRPLMELKSQVVHLHRLPAGEPLGYVLRTKPADGEPKLIQDGSVDHERLIATLPFGFVDGVPRALSNGKGWVVIRGKKCPFAGLLAMDQCMVDVTEVADVAVGDDVVIFSHHGEAMGYVEAAALCDFNKNGLQAALARRVPRVYFENGAEVVCSDYLLR